MVLSSAAQAQSTVWGGPASTTTTQNYKLGTNWDPNGAPVAAGQSAIFDTTGKSTINVNAGAIAPDSWTFNANSQSYTIGGAAVNFSATGGLFNTANAGQTISIDNNLGESAAGAQLQQFGNSTLVLTGNNSYSGGTVIAVGTVQIGNGGTTGKISGDVLDLGVLAFNRSNNITFGGGILGTGQVNQIGTGTLILTGNNSYSGGTLISNGGTLRANNSSAVGAGTVTLDDGQFQAGAGNLTFSNNFVINNTSFGSAIDTNGHKLTISGNITDASVPGGALTVRDSTTSGSVLVLTGANTYSGGTTICNCATLQLGTATSSGSIVRTVNNEGVFNIVNADTSGITTVTNQFGALMTFRNSTNAGTMTIDNFSGGPFPDVGLEFRQASSAANAVINNKLFGTTTFFNTSTAAAASITNNDDGQLHFYNQSTAGTATISNKDSGVLDFNNRSSADNATIVNSSLFGMAFLNRSTAGNAFITTNNNSATFFFDRSDGGTARFETEGGSIVDFSGSRGANNDGLINAGSIAGAGNYYIGDGNTLSVGGNDRSTTVSGIIADSCGCSPGDIGALEKVGAGTLTLSGANTYSGGTTLTGGIVQVTNASSVGAGAVTLNGGTFQADGLSDLTFGNNFKINTAGGTIDNNGTTLTIAGVISNGNGNTGALLITDSSIHHKVTVLSGVNTYSGGTTVVDTTLVVTNSDPGVSSSVGTGAVTLQNAQFRADGLHDLTFSNDFKLIGAPGGSFDAQGIKLTISGNVTDGSASGSLSIFNNSFNNGRVILTGTNSYSGGTQVFGTLQLGDATHNGSIVGDVHNQGVFDIVNANTAGIASITTELGGKTNFFNATTAGTALLRNDTGTVTFHDQSSAGNAIIKNDDGVTNFGIRSGTDTASAGNATITNDSFFGTTEFNAFATAGNAKINTNNFGKTEFWDHSTAGNAIITTGGNFGATLFGDNSTGGNAQFITNGTGLVDFSGSKGLNNDGRITAGSIAGSGRYYIGAGNTLVVGGNGLSTEVSGVIADNNPCNCFPAGPGALEKVGSGTLTLSGINTYSGGTTVAGGNLRVDGSVVGAVNVQSGSTLSGIGTVGGLVTIQSGGTLSAGHSPGTLTVGALNLNAGSTSVFELGSAGVVGGASNDLVNVTGNLTLGGTLSVNAPSAGYYRLFNYGTLTSSSFDNINGSSNGTPTVLTNVPNQVNLLIAAAGQRIQFWDGADQTGNGVVNGGAGTWNAANTNWTGAPGQAGINDQWRSSVGVFAGTAGTVTIAGAQAFDTLQFSTTGYVLNAGAGGQLQLAGLSGAGTVNTDNGIAATIDAPIVNGSSTSLTKVGSGTLILTGANTYSGGTTISGGTLQLGNGGTTGSILGNVTDNGTFAINRSDAVTFSGAISGSGAFQQLGAGTTTLTADNNYTGGTTISAGTLQLGIGGTTGSIVGNVLDNGVLAVNRSNALALGGVISGSGAFEQRGAGATTLSGANTYTGATTISNGTLTIAAGGSVTSNVTNGAAFNNSGSVAGNVISSGTFTNNASGTVSGLLTNTAGTTTNAGQLNGGALVTGGTLNTSGTILNGLTNAATVNASGGGVNGAIANNANGTFNVLGTVTSDNIFTNTANATLAIGASGAYTLQGLLTNSGAVTVAGGGQLIDTVGGIANNTGGVITVAFGGTVKDDLNNAGVVTNNGAYVANVATNTGAGSITNAATGTWTGNVLGNAAAITNNGGWAGNVASNVGTIDNNKTWTGTVSNAGTFNNSAGATVSGLLTNTAGTTVNNGALNGGANVSGGMFTGSGTVTNLTVAGGIFAPGNGTPGSSMTVSGNLAFQSGALYLVGLNPATSTFATVTGTAALNGGAGAAFLAGNYVAKQYTILTAAGGVSGAFGSFDTLNIPGGFRASLSYDAKNVFLNLDLALAKYSGLNANQQNVANALTNFFNATGGIPAVFGTLTPAGLTQASGELVTASQQATFDAMNLFLGLLTDPFVAGRGTGVTAGAAPSQFAEEGDAGAYAAGGKPRSKSERDAYAAVYRKAPLREVYDPRWSVWSAGYGGSQTTDGNIALGSNNTRSSIGGVAVGADYLFSPRTIAGFAVAGGGTGFSVNGQGSGRSDLFQAGAFVRHTAGPAYISAALAYGWQNVTTDRTVTIAGTDLLHANFNANTWSGRVEGGYRFVAPWMGGVGITPYAAGQFTTFDLPAYAEQAIAGANTFALTYGAKSVTDSRSELGIRTDKSYPMQNGIFTLRGRAAWAHDFNPDRNIGATFQTLPGASFVVNGALQASDSALVTASAEMKWLNGFSLAATFEGAFSSVTSSYAGKGVARYTW
jgi:fibronectin-binding autotransporter adhesin